MINPGKRSRIELQRAHVTEQLKDLSQSYMAAKSQIQKRKDGTYQIKLLSLKQPSECPPDDLGCKRNNSIKSLM